MFKKNQRVLYMGSSTWHIATVMHDQIDGDDMVDIQPHGMNTSSRLLWIPFDAPVERLSLVPDNITTVEAAVAYLHSMGNWADKS